MKSNYVAWKPRECKPWPERNTHHIWSPDGKRKFPRHIFVPDWQACKGVPGEHISAVGVYCAYKKPDVIVLAGDMGDFPSCSYWDRAKWFFGERSYGQDCDALEHALQLFLAPILEENGRTGWLPRILVTLGNHEYRVERALEATDGGKWRDAVELPEAIYERYGVEVFPFLHPVMIDGIAYCHYFPNPMTGKPQTGMMQTMLKNVGFSFTQGHKQVLDMGNRTLANGQKQRGLIAGACYLHNEDYRPGPGNLHWRGIIMKNEVDGYGDYSVMDINIQYLLREHGGRGFKIGRPDPNWEGCEPWKPYA